MDSLHNSRYVQYKERLLTVTGSSVATVSKKDIYRKSNPTVSNSTGSVSGSDSANYTSSGQNSYKSLAPNAPAEVKNAWAAAASKVGVNALDDSTNTYLSCLFAMQTEQKKTTGSGDVLGSTKESAIAAVKKALTRLEGLETEVTNTMIKEYRQKEKDFYNALLVELNALD